MRGGYPVDVVHIFKCEFDRETNRPTGKEEHYWQARSGGVKFRMDCGHQHDCESEAKKCLPGLTLKYREMRWPGSTGQNITYDKKHADWLHLGDVVERCK